MRNGGKARAAGFGDVPLCRKGVPLCRWPRTAVPIGSIASAPALLASSVPLCR
jgi:hypothetical protein